MFRDDFVIQNGMKRVLVTILIVLLSFLCGGCSSKRVIEHRLSTYKIETTERIPYVYYDTLVLDDISVDFEKILASNKCGGTFHQVYVIQDDTIWFGFADAERNKNGSVNWNIASVNVSGKEFEICYTGEFCLNPEADKFYMHNNDHNSADIYQTDNGFYHAGKIVLTDHIKTVEYDLLTNSSIEYEASSYEYPETLIEAEIIDYCTILFSQKATQKVFDVNQAKQTSLAFKELHELEKKENWQGKSYLSELFDKVQIVNNQVYIICRVINWSGETHAIVFQYDFNTNSCKYAFHCFMDDLIGNNLYVVPII